MATGNSIFICRPRSYIPPGNASGEFAYLGHVVSGDTIEHKTPVIWFEDDVDSRADWKVFLPSHYTGGTGAVGITFEPHYLTDGVSTANIEFEIAILDLSAGDDMSSDLAIASQAVATSTDAPSATAFDYDIAPTAALTDDQYGSPAKETEVIVRVMRDVSASANADRVGLIALYAIET